MPIVVDCPHCETRFHLQPELAGKSMRCPNPDCREIFQVKPVGEATVPPQQPTLTPIPPASPPPPMSRSVEEVVPVVEAVLADPKVVNAGVVNAEVVEPEVVDAEVIDAGVVDAEVVDAVVVATPTVREVVWTPGADVPLPPRTSTVAPEPEPEPDTDVFLPRRRKKANRWPAFALIGMVSSVALIGLYIGLSVMRNQSRAETELAQQARTEYQAGNYTAAAKSFEHLAAEYPESTEHERYDFLAQLALLQRDVRTIATRENPTTAITKVLGFVATYKDSSFLSSTEGSFRADIVSLGRKVADDTADHIDDHVKLFRSDRTRITELAHAESTIASGRDFVQKLEPLSIPTDPPFAGVLKRFDAAQREITDGRKWVRVIRELRALLTHPTDQSVEDAKQRLALNGLSADSEAVKLVRDAESLLGRQVRYEASVVPARKPPTDHAGSLAFVAPLGPTIPFERAIEQKPGTFLAVARGLVYALDEASGKALWSARVGPEVAFPPAVATVDLGGGPAELAIVLSNGGGQASAAGHDLRTGVLRWSQSLPAAPAGPALVVGTRALIPLRDESGTLVELDLTTGERIGFLTLAQPLGPPPVLWPESGLIYAVADARRVYVIDANVRDAEGKRSSPRCVQVLTTGHQPGTIRLSPLLLGPPGKSTAQRWIAVPRITSPTGMQLDVFALPALPAPRADGLPPPAIAVTSALSTKLLGWLSFPPVSDGQHVALMLDSGELRLFGMNQPGNRDPVLFPLPGVEHAVSAQGEPAPGLAVVADGTTFLMLSAEAGLKQLRLGIDPIKGFNTTVLSPATSAKQPQLRGIPIQAAQIAATGDAVMFVLQDQDGLGCHAAAVQLSTGTVRWQRQLGSVGLLAAASSDGVTLIGEDGTAAFLQSGSPWPRAGTVGVLPASVPLSLQEGRPNRTFAVASADGVIVHSFTSLRIQDQNWLVVRQYVNGHAEREGRIRTEVLPAGEAIALGGTIVFPGTDGFIHRVRWEPKNGKEELDPVYLESGPRWRTNDARPDAACFLVSLGIERLALTDGDRTVTGWIWPANGIEQPGGITWKLPHPIAIPPLFLPGHEKTPPRLLLADITGAVALFATDRTGEPIREWKPNDTTLPSGKPTSPFVVQPGAFGGSSVAYVVANQHLVTLDPDNETARWSIRGDDRTEHQIVGTPRKAGQGIWLVTELGGRVLRVNLANGQNAVVSHLKLQGIVPVAAGVPIEPFGIVVPLSDGSAAIIDTTQPQTGGARKPASKNAVPSADSVKR